MTTELRCDETHAKIVGIDAGAGPMILYSGDHVIRVEVLEVSDDGRANLRWEAVRRMITNHTHEPEVESELEADVIELRKDA